MRDPADGADDLALTALRFAAGDLSAAQAEAFAERMAHDQAARDALSDAIRLSAAALGQVAPVPDPSVRRSAEERLRPTVWTRLFPRQRYRGHPVVWAGLGGAVAASLTVVGVWLGDDPPAPRPGSAPFVALPADTPAPNGTIVRFEPAEPSEDPPPVAVAVEIAPPPSPVEVTSDPGTVVSADREPDRSPPAATEGRGGRKPAVDARIGDD